MISTLQFFRTALGLSITLPFAYRAQLILFAFFVFGTLSRTSAAEFIAPRIISITPLVNQGLDMVLSVPHDRKYAIQATSDFLTWTELGADTATNGVFRFLDQWVAVASFDWNRCSQFEVCVPQIPIFSMHPTSRFYRLLDLSEPESISGRVYDASGAPIAGATISMVGNEKTAVTDELGAFTFQAHSTNQPLTRVFIADAPGRVRAIAQPIYAGSTPRLEFRLENQLAAQFAPESLAGHKLLFAGSTGGALKSISFTNGYRTDSGVFYVPIRTGDQFYIHQIAPSGVFKMMRLRFGPNGCGDMAPFYWINEGYATALLVSFVDTYAAVTPPEALHNHQIDLEFLYDFSRGPYRRTAKLELVGLNSGEFTATGFLNNGPFSRYNYSVQNQIATLSFLSDSSTNTASCTFVFTSPSGGRFVHLDETGQQGFVGVFQNFFSLANSISLTTDITYHTPLPYSDQFQFILGGESSGFRFFTLRGQQGIYQLTANESQTTLTLHYTIRADEAPTDEIDALQLHFTTPTSGSISGQMQTRESTGITTYPITGSFLDFRDGSAINPVAVRSKK